MNPVRTLVASLTIALLASSFAGCFGAADEASMKDLYGKAKARAESWNAGAVLVHAGTVEAADVEKFLGEDGDEDEDDEDAEDPEDAEDVSDGGEGADGESGEPDVDEETESGDDDMPFKLRDDPDAGNGKGVFWGFLFADPESGRFLNVLVETDGEKVHVLDEEDMGMEEGDGTFEGFTGFEWKLDSDTAASKAHANDAFHDAAKKLDEPVYFVGLGAIESWDEEDEEEAADDDAAAGEANGSADAAESPFRAVWVINAMGPMSEKAMADDEDDEDGEHEHDGDSMDGDMGWGMAFAAIDAVTGKVLESGAYDDEADYDYEYGFDYGYGYDYDEEFGEGFTAFTTSTGGQVTQLQPEDALTVPVEFEGMTLQIDFCYGGATRTGSATFQVTDPTGKVLHEFEADKGPLSVGGGSEAWRHGDLVVGDYDVAVKLNGGLSAEWGMDVWVGSGDTWMMDADVPNFSGGGCYIPPGT